MLVLQVAGLSGQMPPAECLSMLNRHGAAACSSALHQGCIPAVLVLQIIRLAHVDPGAGDHAGQGSKNSELGAQAPQHCCYVCMHWTFRTAGLPHTSSAVTHRLHGPAGCQHMQQWSPHMACMHCVQHPVPSSLLVPQLRCSGTACGDATRVHLQAVTAIQNEFWGSLEPRGVS